MKIYIETIDERSKYAYELLSKIITIQPFKSFDEIEKDSLLIYAPNKKIDINLVNELPENLRILGGNQTDNILDLLAKKNIIYTSFMKDEVWTLKNAILTSEGVLANILQHSPKSIYENNILLLGGGRITKSCAILFGKLGLNYTIAVFSEKDYEAIHTFGKNIIYGDLVENISKFDVIINTIPSPFIDDDVLTLISNDCLFIETASYNSIRNLENVRFHYLPAPALPTKFCPKSAGSLFADVLIKFIKEKNYVK